MIKKAIKEIDEMGRIALPEDLRKAMGWRTETKIKVSIRGRHIELKAYLGSCFLCGNKRHNHLIWGKSICDNCINEISRLH